MVDVIYMFSYFYPSASGGKIKKRLESFLCFSICALPRCDPLIVSMSCKLQVDSVSCYCKVDSGLKTIIGARKFVPGAKLCLQPEIMPNGPRSRNSRRERSRNQEPLVPGLPDDLAIACLARVPRVDHQNLRFVCKRWNRLLSGNYFYSLRKKLGMAEEWVYVIKRDRGRRISWHAFDPIHQLWRPLPPVPADYSEAVGFGCAVLSGCYLYLFGGKDPSKGSMRHVVFYNARTNKWHRAPDMIRKRHFFGSCVINNCLYVAGGKCEGGQRTLHSAEVYDPSRNRWTSIAEMNTGMVPFFGVVYDGKWFLKGLNSHCQLVSQVYIPTANTWDGCKLRVFERTTDSWNKFMDSKHHLGNSQVFEAASFVSLNGKLGIIRNNMSIISAAISGLHWIEIRSTVGCRAMASTGYEAARRLEGGELKGGRMSKEAQQGHGHTHGRTAHNMSSSSLRKKSDLSLVSKVRCRFLRALLANLQEIFLGTKLFVLFPAVPLAVAASYFNFGRAWLFALSLLGLAPLAERVSFLTEQIAYYTGPTVGGLLNATCGNATELIIALFALREGKIEVVKCSLVGSVLSNLLLVLGTSLFFGGLANLHKEQFYDRKQADVNTGLLLLGALCHILLLMFGYAMNSGEHAALDTVRRLALSRACSVVMLLAYVAYLFFQLKTHRQLFESKEGDEDHDDGVSEDEPVIGFPCAVAWLVGMTTVIAALSEYVVGTIEAASDSWGISVSFISIILLPIVGNAAEHAGAIIFAFKNKLDITLGVSLGSATQISMFVVPLSVLVAWIMGIEMDLDLKLLETGSLIMAILVIAFTLQDGTAHYLKGLVPLLCYIAIAACFYVYRSPSKYRVTEHVHD
ncbi:unnamed protein product [Musa banksii]